DILDFCGDAPVLAGVANSVAFTMRDPSYLKKLNASNDRKGMISQFRPATAPRMSAPSAEIHIAMREPGLGGSAASPFSRQRVHPPDDDRRDQ
ncbi:MAG TPA: hypothetical protein VIF12_05615, partial [Micavibrio sp.]